jgi:hypothetical protein
MRQALPLQLEVLPLPEEVLPWVLLQILRDSI